MHAPLNPIGAMISRACPKIVLAQARAVRGEWVEGMIMVKFLDNLTPLTVGRDIIRHSRCGPTRSQSATEAE